jgi:hypothetical protein
MSISERRGDGCGELSVASVLVGDCWGLMKSGHLKVLDLPSGLSSPYRIMMGMRSVEGCGREVYLRDPAVQVFERRIEGRP